MGLVGSARQEGGQEGVEGVDQLEVRRKRPQLPGQATVIQLGRGTPGWEKAGYTWAYLVTPGTHKGQLGGGESGPHHDGKAGRGALGRPLGDGMPQGLQTPALPRESPELWREEGNPDTHRASQTADRKELQAQRRAE